VVAKIWKLIVVTIKNLALKNLVDFQIENLPRELGDWTK